MQYIVIMVLLLHCNVVVPPIGELDEKLSLQEQEQTESPDSPPEHTAGIGEVRQSVLESSEHSK